MEFVILSLSISLFIYFYALKEQRIQRRENRDVPIVTTKYPPIACLLKGLTLGLYRKDGTFHILRESYVKNGVMYCVENRELICVNSLIVAYYDTRRPRWIDHIYVAGWTPTRVKQYIEEALHVQIS